ncbi:unnamed protein product [Effrenium voratum]|nr:unnamed protein product [Effrenium voratum]
MRWQRCVRRSAIFASVTHFVKPECRRRDLAQWERRNKAWRWMRRAPSRPNFFGFSSGPGWLFFFHKLPDEAPAMPAMSKISVGAGAVSLALATSAFVAPSTTARQTLRGAETAKSGASGVSGAGLGLSGLGLLASAGLGLSGLGASGAARGSVVRCAYDASKERSAPATLCSSGTPLATARATARSRTLTAAAR